jgi:hypothetical protein
VRLLAYLCLVGIVLAAACFSLRRLFSTSAPEEAALSSLSSPGGAEALQKARLLYQQLMPGETPSLILQRRRSNPADRAAANAASQRTHRPPQEGDDRHDLWIVQSSTDESATAATFLATFDSRSGTLQYLNWAAASPPQRLSDEESADGPERLDATRAVAQTHRVLRQLRVPGADGPWTVVSADRQWAAGHARTVWRVNLSSARWRVVSYLGSGSAELLALIAAARDAKIPH